MDQKQFVLPESEFRSEILQSVGFESDEPLLIIVEAMVSQALNEHPTHPVWYPLGARNAEGISAARRVLEGTGWARDTSKNKLEGVRHLENGHFLAIHNTCERTGLEKGLPRFASARKRTATKSLRDDLQEDFFDVIEDSNCSVDEVSYGDETALHLCVFILHEKTNTGEKLILIRAELIVGASCSDFGIAACKYRIPLNVSGLEFGGAAEYVPQSPEDDGAIETPVSIRKRS